MPSKALHVALVRARYSAAGGAERFAARALEALAERAVEVSIIARSWAGAPPARGLQFVRCDPFYIGSLWRDWGFAGAVRRLVAHGAFDLVQSHERIPGLAIYRAGDGVHASWLERRGRAGGWPTRLAIACNPHHRYLCAAERALFEHPDLKAVICNSALVQGEIAARFRIDPAKLHLIPNGVDLAHFQPPAPEARRAAREQLGVAGEDAVLIFVGSGFMRKGVATLLEALALAAPDGHLLIVGQDKHLERYRRRARRLGLTGVRFVGAVADPMPYYAAADGLILPTLYDPFPNAALEALACGVPVITSDASGCAALIVEGHNGWVRQAGAPAEFAAALRCWRAALESVDGRARLAEAARASVLGYSTAALGAALENLYAGLVAVPRGERAD